MAIEGAKVQSILEISDLHVTIGSSHILQSVSLNLQSGSTGLLGRNGMGKTTLCAAIMGLLPACRGSIRFQGQEIVHATPDERARLGIGYVPQGRRVFRSLNVEEHLRMMEQKGGSWTIERVYDTFPRLQERRKNLGNQLSGGEQQMLAIARALLLNPKLLVLDEPTEGLAPAIVSDVVTLIADLRASGMTIFLVEQNIHAAFAATHNVALMVNGQIVETMPTKKLEEDQLMQKRHLGLEPGGTEHEPISNSMPSIALEGRTL